MLSYECIASKQIGRIDHLNRHVKHCIYCNGTVKTKKIGMGIKSGQVVSKEKMEKSLGKKKRVVDCFLFFHYKSLTNYVYCMCTIGQHVYNEWSKSDENMLLHTGHTLKEYEKIYNSIIEDLLNYRQKRSITLNNIPLPTPHVMLSLTLYHLKHYHTERYIANEFNIKRTAVQHILEKVIDYLYEKFVPMMIQLNEANLSSPLDSSYLENTVKLITDATVISIHQPEHTADRKKYFHYKSLTNYGNKFQIATDLNGMIVHVSEVVYASIHDTTLFRSSTLPSLLSDHLKVLGDKGYIGNQYVMTPMKNPQGKKLRGKEVKRNRMISSERVVVENVFHRIKQYHILGFIYRGNKNNFAKITRIVHVICALTNLNMLSHPVRA
jgi:hypothetical protein